MNKDNPFRGTCPVCKYRVYVFVPRNENGSARVCASHKIFVGTQGVRCSGSRVVCIEDMKKEPR